jgi:hypothetical protein
LEFLEGEDCSPTPIPQLGGSGYLSLSDTSLKTCLLWVALPAAGCRNHSHFGYRIHVNYAYLNVMTKTQILISVRKKLC